MRAFFYVLTAFGSLIGGFFLLMAFGSSQSAPQQGALAAIAVAFAVLPYCFARAVERGDDAKEKQMAADLHTIAEHYRRIESQERVPIASDPSLPPMRSQRPAGSSRNPFMPSKS